jgi:hypothetical protein
MNVALQKQVQRYLPSLFIDVPLCRNCVHVLQKDVSFYCNKFKTFALFAPIPMDATVAGKLVNLQAADNP